MLFDQMIIDYKKSNLQAISSRYMKGTYKTKLNDKISIFYGPKHLMKILRYLIMLCIELEPQNRPSYQYLMALTKEGLNFLDRMY